MKQRCSGGGDDFLAGEEVSHIVWYLKIYNHVHMNFLLDSIWSQLNPVHKFMNYLLVMHLVFSSCQHLDFPGGLLPSVFLTEIVITT